jgi:hypothetical protein
MSLRNVAAESEKPLIIKIMAIILGLFMAVDQTWE